MRVVVGFDSATPDLVAAVTSDGELVAERLLEPAAGERPRHARDLLSELEALADDVGGWSAVELLAVGVGPGSVTGLRIGIATARALGQALGKPLAPVGTLAALAAGIEGPAEAPRLAVLDARRGQVFAALNDATGHGAWGPLVLSPAELAERIAGLSPPARAAGDGALRFRGELEAAGADVLPDRAPAHHVSGREVCLLGAATQPVAPEAIRPIYLRPPDAELWRQRDRGGRDRRGG